MEDSFEAERATDSCSPPRASARRVEDGCIRWFPNCNDAGCTRTEYESSTLRGHLGLQRPSNTRVAAVPMLDGLRVLDLATLAAAPW